MWVREDNLGEGTLQFSQQTLAVPDWLRGSEALFTLRLSRNESERTGRGLHVGREFKQPWSLSYCFTYPELIYCSVSETVRGGFCEVISVSVGILRLVRFSALAIAVISANFLSSV